MDIADTVEYKHNSKAKDTVGMVTLALSGDVSYPPTNQSGCHNGVDSIATGTRFLVISVIRSFLDEFHANAAVLLVISANSICSSIDTAAAA